MTAQSIAKGEWGENTPFAISVNGASLEMEGRLEDLESMMLQDETPSCIVLGPIRHLQQAESLQNTKAMSMPLGVMTGASVTRSSSPRFSHR